MTDCATEATRTIVRGTTEYLKVELTADVTLDAQPVDFSLDNGETWLAATGLGAAATTRTYQHLLLPAEQPASSTVDVLVRITDNPEIPIINAGTLTIE